MSLLGHVAAPTLVSLYNCYSHGRVLRTHEFGAEAEVLSKLVAGRNREAQVLTRFSLATTMKPP